MEKVAMRAEAYGRAVQGQTLGNYPAIVNGFMARGLAPDDIRPRENVFTYSAWKHQGRQVRKGEKGVAITTFIPVSEKKDAGGKVTRKGGTRPRTAYVFHVSQTDAE